MIEASVSSVFSIERLMEDIKRVMEDYEAPALVSLMHDATDDYKDRLKRVQAGIDPEDEELVQLMGGYIDGVFLREDIVDDKEVFAIHVTDDRLARLTEYGSERVPATSPLRLTIKMFKRKALAIHHLARRRIERIARSTSSFKQS